MDNPPKEESMPCRIKRNKLLLLLQSLQFWNRLNITHRLALHYDKHGVLTHSSIEPLS